MYYYHVSLLLHVQEDLVWMVLQLIVSIRIFLCSEIYPHSVWDPKNSGSLL